MAPRAASSSLDLSDQLDEFEQVGHAIHRPTCRDDNQRVVCVARTRPARRDRPQLLAFIQVEDPVFTPALAVMGQLKLPPVQRVKTMGYPEASMLMVRIRCIRPPTPIRMSSASSGRFGVNAWTTWWSSTRTICEES